MLQFADFITNVRRMSDNHYITLMCVVAISETPNIAPPTSPQHTLQTTDELSLRLTIVQFWPLKWTCSTIRLAGKKRKRNAKSEANPCYQRRPQITLHLSAKIAMEVGGKCLVFRRGRGASTKGSGVKKLGCQFLHYDLMSENCNDRRNANENRYDYL